MSLQKLLEKRAFVSVATADLQGVPNAAPKFILRADQKFIYLADYTGGKTWENLRINPLVSISLSDINELKGYKINGTVKIIIEGPIHKELTQTFEERKIALSVERVINGVQKQKTHKDFEVGIPVDFAVFQVKIEEITEINPQGETQRKAVPRQM